MNVTPSFKRPEWPEHPADQHQLVWWEIDIHRADSVLVEHRALYHANTPWLTLFPPDDRPPGVDFVDQIQLFESGRFDGRHSTEGLRDYFAKEQQRVYAVRSEALGVARTRVAEAIANRRREIVHYERMFEKLAE